MAGRCRLLPAVLLAALASATSPPLGVAWQAEDARPITPREARIQEGFQVVDLSDLGGVRRQRQAKLDRDVQAGNELRRREVRFRQERMGPTNFNIWSDW